MKKTFFRVRFAMLILFTFTALSCDKDDSLPTPEQVQSFSAKAYPESVSYASQSTITCLTSFVSTVVIKEAGKTIFSGSGKDLTFTTSELRATTTFEIIVGALAPQNVTITVLPVDPKLKLLFDGVWQNKQFLVQRPGETSFSEFRHNDDFYDDFVVWRSNKTFTYNYGTKGAQKSQEGTYSYGVVGGDAQLLWPDIYTVVSVSDTELRLHSKGLHYDAAHPLGTTVNRNHVYANIAKK